MAGFPKKSTQVYQIFQKSQLLGKIREAVTKILRIFLRRRVNPVGFFVARVDRRPTLGIPIGGVKIQDQRGRRRLDHRSQGGC
jgi:hypothetical protein